ncbi:shikimate dehydrogenase [Salinicoccus cyprini]|uniref:Shikimate dehydrogenase (NADP(+)) n=1 Tax=Salinicoccus cyprini TaxID=2493691 RepID=A0A558AYL3_9STAP|nr:shikimate dehydrogenase [Salinicoccus cyprini]TVT29355.1 shikimate dehydrogenase [Salinicoccus cyprini]
MGRYAVIGYPISHTLSPLIHNANFEAKGTADQYSAIAVPPDQLMHIRDTIRSQGLAGFNVTIPHKEKIMEYLDHVDADAMKIGAVNTVSVDGDVLTGHNTDITGYLDAFNQTFGRQHRRILIIGAGGAAKAVHRAHANNGDTVTIAARRMESFQQFRTVDFKAVLISDIPDLDPHDAIINTTPVGMKHEDLFEEMEIPHSIITEDTLGVDLIYQPERTKFLEYFAEGHYMNGMPMLIHQAMDAYTIWTGEQGDIAAVNRKYKAHIGGKS